MNAVRQREIIEINNDIYIIYNFQSRVLTNDL
jgi:hypothetical protein